jgi:hypothetical protein
MLKNKQKIISNRYKRLGNFIQNLNLRFCRHSVLIFAKAKYFYFSVSKKPVFTALFKDENFEQTAAWTYRGNYGCS